MDESVLGMLAATAVVIVFLVLVHVVDLKGKDTPPELAVFDEFLHGLLKVLAWGAFVAVGIGWALIADDSQSVAGLFMVGPIASSNSLDSNGARKEAAGDSPRKAC